MFTFVIVATSEEEKDTFHEELFVTEVSVVKELPELHDKYLFSLVLNAKVPDAEPATTVKGSLPVGVEFSTSATVPYGVLVVEMPESSFATSVSTKTTSSPTDNEVANVYVCAQAVPHRAVVMMATIIPTRSHSLLNRFCFIVVKNLICLMLFILFCLFVCIVCCEANRLDRLICWLWLDEQPCKSLIYKFQLCLCFFVDVVLV